MAEREAHTIYMSVKRQSPREEDIAIIAHELRDSSYMTITKLQTEEDGTTIFYPRPNDPTIAGEETSVFQITYTLNGSDSVHPYHYFTNRLEVLENARRVSPSKK